MTETIRYGLIGREDIKVGTSTFEVELANGQIVTLSALDVGAILNDRTLYTRITGLTLDVKRDFGAVGDAVTDDTAAIQAAFNAAQNVSGNGVANIHFPSGTYAVTAELTLNAHFTDSITGSGYVRILWTGAVDSTKAVLRLTAPVSGRMTVFGITFDANNKAGYALRATGAAGTLIKWDTVQFQNATVEQVHLGSNTDDDIALMFFDRAQFTGNGTYGLVVDSDFSFQVSVDRSVFTATGSTVLNHVYNKHGHQVHINHSNFGQMSSVAANTAAIRTAGTLSAKDIYTEESRFLIVDSFVDAPSILQKMVVLDNVYSQDSRDTLAGADAIVTTGDVQLSVSNVNLGGVGNTVNNRHRTVTIGSTGKAVFQNTQFTNGSSTGSNFNADGLLVFTALMTLDNAASAPRLLFRPAATQFNFRLGAQDNVSDAFEITPSTVAGGTTFSTPAIVVHSTGGVRIGNPTGGDQGAGTLNVDTNIFRDGTAYTNPDYILEHWATGKIERFADREGAREYQLLKSFDALKEYVRAHYTLPLIAQARERAGGRLGVFDGGDAVLAALEEAYLYIFQLEERLKRLEAKMP